MGVLARSVVCKLCCVRACQTCGCGSTSSPTKLRVPPDSPASPVSVPVRLVALALPGANISTATSPATPSPPTQSRTTLCPTHQPPAGPAPRSASTRAPVPPRRSPPGGCVSRLDLTGQRRQSSRPPASRESSRLSTGRTSSNSATPGEARGGAARLRRAPV